MFRARIIISPVSQLWIIWVSQGGTIEMGNLKAIKVIRFRNNKVEKGADTVVERGDTIIVPVSFRKTFTDYLQIVAGLATLVFAAMAATN